MSTKKNQKFQFFFFFQFSTKMFRNEFSVVSEEKSHFWLRYVHSKNWVSKIVKKRAKKKKSKFPNFGRSLFLEVAKWWETVEVIEKHKETHFPTVWWKFGKKIFFANIFFWGRLFHHFEKKWQKKTPVFHDFH